MIGADAIGGDAVGTVRHSSNVKVRLDVDLKAAVATAAKARGMKPAEYHRQALQTALRLDGIEPTQEGAG